MTPAELLAAAGHLLHGEHWIIPLARDLDISAKQIRRWVSGHTPFPVTHGVLRDVARIMRSRGALMIAMAARMNDG